MCIAYYYVWTFSLLNEVNNNAFEILICVKGYVRCKDISDIMTIGSWVVLY